MGGTTPLPRCPGHGVHPRGGGVLDTRKRRMRSLLLQSVFLSWIVIPALAALDRDSRRGFRRMLFGVFAFNVLYLAYLTLVHVSAFVPSRW